jgi:hypothetical protein
MCIYIYSSFVIIYTLYVCIYIYIHTHTHTHLNFVCNGMTYFCIRDLGNLNFDEWLTDPPPPLHKCSRGTLAFYVGSFTSRVVFFQEGNPRDWRDRLVVDDTWTVTVHVDLGTEGR